MKIHFGTSCWYVVLWLFWHKNLSRSEINSPVFCFSRMSTVHSPSCLDRHECAHIHRNLFFLYISKFQSETFNCVPRSIFILFSTSVCVFFSGYFVIGCWLGQCLLEPFTLKSVRIQSICTVVSQPLIFNSNFSHSWKSFQFICFHIIWALFSIIFSLLCCGSEMVFHS